ncbi:MAG: tRNA 4-thiouridine(8) synthase ThiI [Candidatus Atribacteria bacterium]|nr:tRNA 4-thiouridine(8) synthase ThiI [Candidatus Atribacteria bacterium]
MSHIKKAIALFSGGLDSILAVKLILEQNIEVIGVRFETPFIESYCDHYIEQYLGISLIKKDISNDFKKILYNPRHGYGKRENPCIDCRILMFRKAGELMEEEKALLIISGEVLGQRPMTQNKRMLQLISEESGYANKIIRPLSALLLPETDPEKDKIIDRLKLLDIQGRSRKRQIALAEQWGIKKYPTPAGGCKLTEPSFAKRLNELMGKITNMNYHKGDIDLLKVGRHFSLNKEFKLVVGRNENENQKIISLFQPQDYLLSSQYCKGPVSLLRRYTDLDDEVMEVETVLDLASRIVARYCDKGHSSDLVDIVIWSYDKTFHQTRYVQSFSDSIIQHYLI